MAEKTGDRYLFAQDAGGSMTDCFLIDDEGKFATGKYLTNHANESMSYLGSLEDAARRWNMTSADIHQQARTSIYTGTTMVNILVRVMEAKWVC